MVQSISLTEWNLFGQYFVFCDVHDQQVQVRLSRGFPGTLWESGESR